MPSVRREGKLYVTKQVLNFAAGQILGLCPERSPSTPQARLIDQVFKRLERILERDVQTGCFDDRNFSRLVRALRRALIYLCEEDRYYRRWVGLGALLTAEELGSYADAFSPKDAVDTSARPLGVTPAEFDAHKRALMELALSGYLYGLGLMPERDLPLIARARDNAGEFSMPSTDKGAYFKLFFRDRERGPQAAKKREG